MRILIILMSSFLITACSNTNNQKDVAVSQAVVLADTIPATLIKVLKSDAEWKEQLSGTTGKKDTVSSQAKIIRITLFIILVYQTEYF